MKNFKVEQPQKYANASQFSAVNGGGIHCDTSDHDSTRHRITLSFTPEEGEYQYPLEDLLDEYLLYVSDFFDSTHETWQKGERVTLEFAGDLDGVRKAASLVGKRVYNNVYVEDGEEYVGTVIE